jgi:hypothetical protein
VTPVASKLNVAPALLQFGAAIVLPPNGVASGARIAILSVAKNQPAPVTIEAIQSSDPEFAVQPNNCATIAPGTKCGVPLVFTPTGVKGKTALLVIQSNASNPNPPSVTLKGVGKQGRLSIKPRSLGFGTATVGAPPTSSKTATLTNNNPVPMAITGITSSNPAVFPITTTCGATLAIGAQCTVSAGFMAQRNGGIEGFVFITDNAMNSPQKIRLSGNGTGGPKPTPTAKPTSTATPTPGPTPVPFTFRAFPAMH